MRSALVAAFVTGFLFASGCRETPTATTAGSHSSAPSGGSHSSATRGGDVGGMHDDMTATAREAEQHLGQGVKLLYNADRSQVFNANAPAATKEFSKSLEALLAHEARNPELYTIPAITAGMVEFRARAYKERATSYLIQGHLELYVRDWEKVLEIVEELRPKLAAALADPATDDEWIESLKAVDASVVAMQGDANGALGLHYLMMGDRSTAESYLGRALEVLPADDAKRENIEQILKATAPAE